MDHLFFYIGLSFILLHEMDAMRCREWRIFPILSVMNDRIGMIVFQLAHIPLFLWILYRLTQANQDSVESFIFGFDIFLMIHLGLHLLFLMHKKNEFKDWLSWLIIAGAALGGLLDLLF